jgi:molecular chaperone DnaK
MVRDAETYEVEDRRKREQVETHNQLDGLIFSTEKVLGENRDKLPGSDRAPLEQAIAEGKDALQSDDLDRMKAAVEAVTQASHKVAEAMYQSAAGGSREAQAGGGAYGPPPGGPHRKPADDGAIDAEFTTSS